MTATFALCPHCGKTTAIPIQYGYILDPGILAQAKAGELLLGGCDIKEDGTDPTMICKSCGHEWVGDEEEENED